MLSHEMSAVVQQKVSAAARACILKALAAGKSGVGLRFCGHPNGMNMTWPSRIGPPPFPTQGVWHDGEYMGNDG